MPSLHTVTESPLTLPERPRIRRHLRHKRRRKPQTPRIQLAKQHLLLRLPRYGIPELMANDQDPDWKIRRNVSCTLGRLFMLHGALP